MIDLIIYLLLVTCIFTMFFTCTFHLPRTKVGMNVDLCAHIYYVYPGMYVYCIGYPIYFVCFIVPLFLFYFLIMLTKRSYFLIHSCEIIFVEKYVWRLASLTELHRRSAPSKRFPNCQRFENILDHPHWCSIFEMTISYCPWFQW